MNLFVKINRRTGHDFRASCPALPGCVVYGRSRIEVKDRIQEAVLGYLASLDVALPAELSRLAAAGTS